jgi:uncharacterized membrane protein YedE/YeeE
VADTNLIGGLLGGAMIGSAAVLLLAFKGRVAGISGILAGLFGVYPAREKLWRVVFIAGLIGGALCYSLVRGSPPLRLQAHGAPLIVAGLLVGFGTALALGCTSGHGVCGLARRSKRSLIATVTFIAAAMITVFIRRHLL